MNRCHIQYVVKLLQYLVVQDEDTEVCYSLSYRNGDVPSVWTEVLNGRVRTPRDLSGTCLYNFTSLYSILQPFDYFIHEINVIKELDVPC